MTKTDAFIDEWQRSGVLLSRIPYFQNRIFGARSTVRFDNGFVYEANRTNSDLMRKLAYFAYLGAPLLQGNVPLPRHWLVDESNSSITSPDGLRFSTDSFDPYVFAETFLSEIHFQGNELSGKTIVDIGGYVGDTALYFAAKGARVFVYEPDEANYRKLLGNLALNPLLSPRILPRNLAVGIDGKVPFLTGRHSAGKLSASSLAGTEIDSVSLDSVLDKEKIDHPFLLKADCKGSEYEISGQQAISQFSRLAIEYYTADGKYRLDQLLSRITAAGFRKLRVFKHFPDGKSLETSGVIETCGQEASP
jgi:FkbM family methyltransferase